MPLSLDEAREYARLKGFNPDEVDVDQFTGEIKPRVKVQPALRPSTAEPGKLETAGRSFALGIIPSAASIPVGVAAGAKVGAALTPMMGPAAAIPGVLAGLAAGMGAGTLASTAQEAVLEQTDAGKEFLQKAAVAQQAHPIPAAVGNVLSSLPAGMRVNQQMLKDAAYALSRPSAGAPLTQKLMHPAVQNIGISGALGGGMSAVEDIQADQEVNIPKALVNTVLQGLVSDVSKSYAAKVPGLAGAHYQGEPLARFDPAITEALAQKVKLPSAVDVMTPDELAAYKAKVDEVTKQQEAINAAKRSMIISEQSDMLNKKLDAELESLKKQAAELEALTKSVEGTEYTAKPELMEAARLKAQEKGVPEFEEKQTGLLTNKPYGSFLPEKIEASTFAGIQKEGDKDFITTLPEMADEKVRAELGPRATTPIHETVHAQVYNIVESTRKQQREVGEQMRKAVEASKEYKAWYDSTKAKQKNWEEFATRQTTIDIFRDPSHQSRNAKLDRQAASRLQSGEATLDDVVRILGMKWRYEQGLNAPRAKGIPAKQSLATDVQKLIEERERNPEMEQMEFPATAQKGTPASKYLRDTAPENPNMFMPKKPELGQQKLKLSEPERVDRTRDWFARVDEAIGFKSAVKEPTPGTFQSLSKLGEEADFQAGINAVKAGTKPAFAVNTEIWDTSNLPSGLVLRKLPADLKTSVGDAVVTRSGDNAAFGRIVNALRERSPAKTGKALGYTDVEIAEFQKRNNLLNEFEQSGRTLPKYSEPERIKDYFGPGSDPTSAEDFANTHRVLKDFPEQIKKDISRWPQHVLSDYTGLTRGRISQIVKEAAAKGTKPDWIAISRNVRQAPAMETVEGVRQAMRDPETQATIYRERPQNLKVTRDLTEAEFNEIDKTISNAFYRDAFSNKTNFAKMLEMLDSNYFESLKTEVKADIIHRGIRPRKNQPLEALKDQARALTRAKIQRDFTQAAKRGEFAKAQELDKGEAELARKQQTEVGEEQQTEIADKPSSVAARTEPEPAPVEEATSGMDVFEAERTREMQLQRREAAAVKLKGREGELRETLQKAVEELPELSGAAFREADAKYRKQLSALLDESRADMIVDAIADGNIDADTIGAVVKRVAEGKFSEPELPQNLKPLFTTQLSKELESGERLFGLEPAKDGSYSTMALLKKMPSVIPTVERELLEKAGLKDWMSVQSRITPDRIKKWLDENGPKVEVHSYGMEGKASEAKREYDRMTHEWYDNLSGNTRNKLLSYRNSFEGQEFIDELVKDGFDREHATKAAKYFDLRDTVSVEQASSPRATSYYDSVSALPTEEPMPEWTTTKDSKNVQRVDVVVPRKKPTYEEWRKTTALNRNDNAANMTEADWRAEYADRVKDSYDESVEYGKDLWQPDNLHENVPNTLGWAMIQYKDGPNGERIALIAEAQSQWAQKRRANEPAGEIYETTANEQEVWAQDKRNADLGTYTALRQYYSKEDAARHFQSKWNHQFPDHPLLRDYNRLILKAAIDQARKEGATHVVVSDAETAMMTEKLDSEGLVKEFSSPKETYDYNQRMLNKYGLRDVFGVSSKSPNEYYSTVDTAKLDRATITKLREEEGYLLDREAGFRTNYNKSLPDIASKITGDEGTRVSLGEHKNAFDETMNRAARGDLAFRIEDTAVYDPEESAKVQAKRLMEKNGLDYAEPYVLKNGRRYFVQYADYDTMLSLVSYPERAPRENLIFTNPDGTPKTDVSGLLFDIRQPAERLAKGEQMTLAGRKFSEPELPSNTKASEQGRIRPLDTERLRLAVRDEAATRYYSYKHKSGLTENEVYMLFQGAKSVSFFDSVSDTKTIADSFNKILSYRKLTPDEAALKNKIYESLKNADSVESAIKNLDAVGIDVAAGLEFLDDGKLVHVNYTRQLKNIPELTEAERSNRERIEAKRAAEQRAAESLRIKTEAELSTVDYWKKFYPDKQLKVIGRAPYEKGDDGIWREIEGYEKHLPENYKAKLSEPELPVDPATGKPITRTDASKQGFFETLAAQFDQVRKYDSKVADAMSNAELQREMYEGQFLYKPLYELRRKFGNRASDRDYVRAFDYARAKFREDSVKDSDWTPLQREIALHWNSQVSRPVREVQQANGMKVETREGMKREAKLSPWYAADMLNEKMLDIFTRSTDSKTVEHYKKMWAEHVVEASKATPEAISYKDAYDEVTNFITAIGQGGVHSAEFGALRKSKGFGLPEEMRERDIRKMMERYARRASRDLANFKLLESDPYVRSRLRLPNPETDAVDTSGEGLLEHEEVRDAMKFIRGNFEYVRSPRVMAVARAVTNGILGPISGLRDTATIPTSVLPYVRSVEDGLDIIRSLGRVNEEWNNSLRVGARTGEHRLLAIDTVQGLDRFTNTFNAASEVLRKYQGRDALEQFNRVWSFAIGKNLAERAIVQKNKKFLDRFGALAFDEKTKSWNTDVLAKNFTDAVQGTYGGRGLPSKVVDGMAAPWFALARWSLEKSNVIFKDVIKPAYGPEKNFGPLITYALGAWMTGEAIESMVEMLNNDKKSPDAKWKELKAADADAEQYALRLANVMQLGSFAGMAGDVLKMGADLYSGETPQGFSVPMAQLFSEGIARNMSNFSRAVRDGADPIDALGILTMEFLKTQVQTVRVASNWMNEDEVERKNKFRDIRVWKKLTGEEVPSDFAKPNVAFRPEEREFKRAKTPEDAAAAFEDLLAQIQSRYADKPAEMKKALERLKRNSYQTFPAPEQDRAKAAEYYDYLVKAYGQAEADARLEDFMSQRAMNKAKARFIPTQVR